MSNNKPTWLSSADCAERTGLSAKALRVYERCGLIEPKRALNGWRGYDLADLERLNAISILKAIGLTLKQIKTLLVGSNPPLKQMLEIQIEACAKRKVDAERAEVIARAALQHLEAQHELTIEELCLLIKGTAMNSLSPQLQQLLDKHMTADEQDNWRHDLREAPQGLDDMKAYALAQQEEIFAPLKTLVDAGAQPTSPEVEALIDRDNQLMTQYAVRERLLKVYESNPTNFGNALNVGRDLMSAANKNPIAFFEQLPDRQVASFFFRAATTAAHWREVEALTKEIHLISQSRNMTADYRQSIIERFSEICKRHHLGNPLVYTKWVLIQRAGLHEQGEMDLTEAWALLIQMLETASL